MKSTTTILTAIFVIIIVSMALAEVPQIINYQGRLTDTGGEPITGSVSMNFKIFNDHETGDSLWSSGPQLVQVTNGLFTHELGSDEPLPYNIFHENQIYLSISVGSDSEMSRIQLVTAPYAMNAVFADSARFGGGWTVYGDNTYHETGNVGINNTSPSEPLSIGANLGNYWGDFITIGNGSEPAGILFGQSESNYGSLYRIPDNIIYMTNNINGVVASSITLDSNRIGIGNYSPQAALSIGGDVGNYYGTWLTIGNNTTSETGFIFGEDEDNNCYIARNGVGTVSIKTKDEGVHYNGLSIYRGKVGV